MADSPAGLFLHTIGMLLLLAYTIGVFRGCYGNTGAPRCVCLHRLGAFQGHGHHWEGEDVKVSLVNLVVTYANFSLISATVLANSLEVKCWSSAFWVKENSAVSYLDSEDGNMGHENRVMGIQKWPYRVSNSVTTRFGLLCVVKPYLFPAGIFSAIS